MNKLSSKISDFIKDHHVLALASVDAQGESSSCSVFYVFDEEEISFVFASDEKTEHMQNISKNERVSGSIHLETKEIGTIRGIQVKAKVSIADAKDKKAYLKAFPYAIVMKDIQVWKMKVHHLKYTDNRLGFGKKEIWER